MVCQCYSNTKHLESIFYFSIRHIEMIQIIFVWICYVIRNINQDEVRYKICLIIILCLHRFLKIVVEIQTVAVNLMDNVFLCTNAIKFLLHNNSKKFSWQLSRFSISENQKSFICYYNAVKKPRHKIRMPVIKIMHCHLYILLHAQLLQQLYKTIKHKCDTNDF